jgi:hypothetical protein
MRHGIFACRLQAGLHAVAEVEHYAVWQLLSVEIWCIRLLELADVISLGGLLVDVHRLWRAEDEVATFVDLDYTSLPQL